MKNTKSKLIVLEILNSRNEAFSVAEILKISNGECDKVTTYRILERLESEGIIHKIINYDGVTKFAKCAAKCVETHHHHDNHIHFSCTECGKVECLNEKIPGISLPSKYKISEISMNVRGLCQNCYGN